MWVIVGIAAWWIGAVITYACQSCPDEEAVPVSLIWFIWFPIQGMVASIVKTGAALRGLWDEVMGR